MVRCCFLGSAGDFFKHDRSTCINQFRNMLYAMIHICTSMILCIYNIYLIRICIFARNWQLITLHSQLWFTTPWFLVFAIHIHRNAAIPRYVFRPQQVPSACCRCSTVPSSRNPWESGEPVKKSGWPVEVGSLSHYLEGFDSQVVQDFFQKYEHVGLTRV